MNAEMDAAHLEQEIGQVEALIAEGDKMKANSFQVALLVASLNRERDALYEKLADAYRRMGI